MKSSDMLRIVFILPFTIIKEIIIFLVKGHVLNDKTGAEFAKKSDYKKYLNPYNKGLLVDGHKFKLTPKHSYMHMMIVGRPGTCKTSGFIIPNIMEKAKDNCSLVINDPKGEIHENTSGFLQQNGYKVLVIDVENPDNSARFNPLLEAKNDMELEQLAEVLILASGSASQSRGGDDFWNKTAMRYIALHGTADNTRSGNKTAMRYIALFLKVLKNVGRENPAYFTLHNLLALVQNFGDDGQPLANFMAKYCTYKHDPNNPKLFNEWLGLICGNKDGIQSAILTALTSLRFVTNDNIVKICNSSDIQLANLRKEKTAIFLVTPPQHSSYYAPFVSIFFKSVFNACMRKMPKNNDKPIYIFHDEFATSYIPNFTDIANTIRGYNVSISIVLQSIRQLNQRYGRDTAESIIGGFSSYLTYAGSDLMTTDYFQNMVGVVRERQKKHLTDTIDTYREYKLLNSDEIRRMDEHQALFLTRNQNPVILDIKPYFERGKYLTQIKAGDRFLQYKQPQSNRTRVDNICFVEL